jgi:hypothetical protein
MKVIDIVKLSNKYLAGEQLTYPKLLPFLDEVIDDINNELNATFPSFSSLAIDGNPTAEDYYDCFPDRYIRSVVCIGVASKFYTMDEEGIISAEGYEMKYQQNLFYMVRDYVEQVPEFFQSDSTGSVRQAEERYVENHLPFDFHLW